MFVHAPRQCARSPVVLALGLLCAGPSIAVELATEVPDLKLRWDTTLKYSAAARLKSQDPVLVANPNLDDGDRNFGKGLISNRLDALTEFDAVYRDFGMRLSAAAWYDTVYNRRNDNPGFAGGAFPNQASVAGNEFTAETRKLHGRRAEMLDAFAFAKFKSDAGDVSLRLGQHSLVWGETLFFAGNGIAGAQMPYDVTKLLTVPNSQAKEFVMPVPQVSAQWQLAQDVSIGAYYQFRYKPNRLPAVGSYLSQSDIVVEGGEQLLLGPPFAGPAPRGPDQLPSNGGQGGLQLRWQSQGTDFGLYAIRFHDKSFQAVTDLGLAPTTIPAAACAGALGPVGVVVGSTCFLAGGPTGYHVTYQQGTQAFGFSASRTFGDANVAIEASIRRNQALSSSHAFDVSGLGAAKSNNTNNPAYAVGDTAHINVSTLWQLPSTPLWREGTLLGEIAWNRVLRCKTNCSIGTPTSGTLDPNATRDAVALRVVFQPTYRQVLTGLDIDVPIGLGYSPKGSRSMALGAGAMPPDGGGDFSIGVNGALYDQWRFSLSATHYFGRVGPLLDSGNSFTYKQTFKDRDFIAASLRRTF